MKPKGRGIVLLLFVLTFLSTFLVYALKSLPVPDHPGVPLYSAQTAYQKGLKDFRAIHKAQRIKQSDTQKQNGVNVFGINDDGDEGLLEVVISPAEETVQELIERWFPEHVQSFEVSEIPSSEKGYEVYEYEGTDDNRISIRGSNGVAMASGLYWYLRDYCNVHISWTGDQINLPETLPVPSELKRVERLIQYSYYQNVCTVSYSMAWWDWKRWQREIDWMAMNGINMPLAFAGQEYVWERVFAKFDLPHELLKDFWTGPAFHAWQRMGNMNGWGGPTPKEWFRKQYELQIKILSRMRSFGMKTVLPGFSGRVPPKFGEVHPDAEITMSVRSWGGFNLTYLLSQSSPLFGRIGAAFIKEQVKLYGTDHLYNCDTFNEMMPSSRDPKYLQAQSAAVIAAMRKGDPHAIWVMQGWLFVNDHDFWLKPQVEGLLSGVPDDQMIILDLYAEFRPIWNLTRSFFGKPWIWCQLHNFGGNFGLYGMLPTLATKPMEAMKLENSGIVGVGMTMEGIDQNYVVYDMLLEVSWSTDYINPDDWIVTYVYRRYGDINPLHQQKLVDAWKILLQHVYSATHGGGVTKSLVVLRPAIRLLHSGFMPTNIFYSLQQLLQVWRIFIEVALSEDTSTSQVETFHFDAIDITRQVLSDYFIDVHKQYAHSFVNLKKTAQMMRQAKIKSEIILDMDKILKTHKVFLFGKWIKDARSWSDNPKYQDLYEFNARNQVTLWGPSGQILDYASKQWSGLLKDYYLKRWDMFGEAVMDSILKGKEFDQLRFSKDILKWEQNWGRETNVTFDTEPVGDYVEILRTISKKYKDLE